MGTRAFRRVIAVAVLLAFVGMGAARASEQAAPQFQEKEGAPRAAKHKMFPWLPVILGVSAGVILVVLLANGRKKTLNVDVKVGVAGFPAATAKYRKGTVVRYNYAAKAGFRNLQVKLDGVDAPLSGSVTMDSGHTLEVAALGQYFTLTVNLGAGTNGTPPATADYGRDQVVDYHYASLDGKASPQVRLDNIVVAASGKVTMDRNHNLTAAITGSTAAFRDGVLTVDGIRYEMALIPPGEFQMGSDSPEANKNERPVHTVRISRPFWFGRTEVTQELFQAVAGYNPSKFKNGGQLPVEHAHWREFHGFIQSLNQMLGENAFRLPTEAEWEYACRAGTTGERYGEIDAIAWYAENSGGRTHAVGQKQANAFGLYDMLGNVWEWTQDIWHDYTPEYQVDPTHTDMGTGYIYRGGCWETVTVRSSMRDRNHFHDANLETLVSVGFRLVRTCP